METNKRHGVLDIDDETKLPVGEARDILRAIRHGELDAVVVRDDPAPAVYTLRPIDRLHALLPEFARCLGEAGTAEQALAAGLARLHEGLGCEIVQYWLPRADESAFECRIHMETGAPPRIGRAVALSGMGLVGRAWREATTVVGANAQEDLALEPARAAEKHGIVASVAAPVIWGDRVVAVLALYRSTPLDDDDPLLNLLPLACAQLAPVTVAKALEERAAMFQNLLDALSDAVYVETPDGTIVHWTPGAEALFGFARDGIMGRHCSLLIPTWRRHELRGLHARLSDGPVHGFVTERLRKDGVPVSVVLDVLPLRDADGRLTAIGTRVMQARTSTDQSPTA